jgi:dipeptidase E
MTRMKLLLTSGGVTNDSIRRALVALLGKPIEEARALLVPTAQWGQPMCAPETVWRTVAGRWDDEVGLVDLGWASVGVLELTALPTIGRDRWEPWVRAADALLVDGGEAVYLAHWMRESGLADLLPALADTLWVGVSAGSMVMTPRVGAEFVDWRPGGTDETLGIVDFSIFPHLDYPGWTSNTTVRARDWATRIDGPAYAIDDQTAISVHGAVVEVISEGHWEFFERPPAPEAYSSGSSSPPGPPPPPGPPGP